jgi:hypothetical protein
LEILAHGAYQGSRVINFMRFGDFIYCTVITAFIFVKNLGIRRFRIREHIGWLLIGFDKSWFRWKFQNSWKHVMSTLYMKFLVRVLHLFLFFGIFSYLSWSYLDQHVYLFLGKVLTYTVFHVINIKKFPPTWPIKTYTFINFWENLPPTRLLGPHAYSKLQSRKTNLRI